nr:ABC-three component system protein [uncultured Rhodopila sp.]
MPPKVVFLRKEHVKIKRLSGEGICDHYLVFTNRRLTGGADEKLTAPLLKFGPRTAWIIAVDRIHMAIDKFRDVRETLPNLNDMLPFRFDPEDLREVIVALHGYTQGDGDSAFDSARDFEKIAIADKNHINGVTPAYYKEIIGPDVAQFPRIEGFLKNPRNGEFADLYHDSANDLKAKILVHRGRFEAFDNVFLFLAEEIQRERDALRGKRRMVRTLLHYMYWNCDIGSKHELSDEHAHA